MGRTTALHQALRLRRHARASRLPDIDRLKEDIAYLKFWQGIAVVTDVSLGGWLIAAADAAPFAAFAVAVAGVVFLGVGVILLGRQIGRRIDQIGNR